MDVQSRHVSDPTPEQIRELLEPDGVPRLEHLAEYIRRYRERYVFDPRTVLFDVHGRTVEREVVLEGWVGSPGLRGGLARSLSALGLTVNADGVQVAPHPETTGDRYALVDVPHSFLREAPEVKAEATDELLLGDPLILMEPARNGYCLVQGPTGYLGWVSESDIRFISRGAWRFWRRQERVKFHRDVKLGAFIVPNGAEIPLCGKEILLPDNTSVPLPDDLRPLDRSSGMVLREKILQGAEDLLGTRYVWAGRSGAGLDCSGFTQMVYAGIGIYLPRDADQQHLLGRVSAEPAWREDLAPGDLLFFTGPMGNITHVALSTGGLDFIHAKGEVGVLRGCLEDCAQSSDHSFLIGKRIIL